VLPDDPAPETPGVSDVTPGTPLNASDVYLPALEMAGTPVSLPPPEQEPVRKRPRWARRVVIDNDATELPSSHIREMLGDTSNITQPCFDPAGIGAVPPEAEGRVRPGHADALMRPCAADGGALHPKLAAAWTVTMQGGARPPFRMRKSARMALAMKKRGREELAEEEEEEESRVTQPPEELEVAREEVRAEGEEMEGQEFEPLLEDMEPVQEEFFGLSEEVNFGISGENEDQPEGEGAFEMGVEGVGRPSISSDASVAFSLGHVNDLPDSPDRLDVSDLGGDASSGPAGRWHPHTVKVLRMLQRNIAAKTAEGEKGGTDKMLSYDELAKGCSRRTAAGVFFELLQLKTWDYVEIAQEEEFADIKVLPGPKFDETPLVSS